MKTLVMRMLDEARALRAAFPDARALRGLPVSDIPAAADDESESATACRGALGYLRDEMLLVRAGEARDLTVLDDEVACAERAMARL